MMRMSLPEFFPSLLLTVLLACVSFSAMPALATSLDAKYASALADLRTLQADAKKAGFRHHWEALEKRFDALVQGGASGDLAARALYQKAKARDGMAQRSYLAADIWGAADLYEQMYTRFPKHFLADDAMLYRALLLSQVGEKRTALALLTPLLKGADVEVRNLARAHVDQLKAQGVTDTKGATPPLRAKVANSATSVQAVVIKPVRTKAPVSSDPATAATEYKAAALVWRNMVADPRNVKPRSEWLGVAQQFYAAYALDAAGSFGPKGLYQAGQAMEKAAAARGGTWEDWTTAASYYAQLWQDYPENSLADDAAYLRARILAKHLDAVALAQTELADALVQFPKGDMRAKLQELQASLVKKAGSSKKPVSSMENAAPHKPAALVDQLGLTIRTVMLDPGHGGKDPGSQGNGLTESAIVLKLALHLGEELKKRGFTVLYTRESDTFISLEKRTTLANEKRVDLFISLHVNANDVSSVNGVETYYLDIAKTRSATDVAARENGVTAEKISDLQFILTDLVLTSKQKESHETAKHVHGQIMERLRRAGFTAKDNGVRSAPFYVLMGARMPAVLVEIGYLSHTNDAKRLQSDVYLQRLAQGLSNGVVAYREKVEKLSSK